MRVRLAFQIVFFFVGTFLHEFAHYLFALVLGRAQGFSVLPRIEKDRVVFGAVKSQTRYKVLSSFVASAPVIWWIVLVSLLNNSRVLRPQAGMPDTGFAQISARIQGLSRWDLLHIWVAFQLLWAGRLSAPDVRAAARGLFSPSGIFFLGAAGSVYYFSRRFL